VTQIKRRLEKIKKDYSYSTNVKHQCDNGLTKVINRTQSHLKGPTCCLGAFAVKPDIRLSRRYMYVNKDGIKSPATYVD
jgi:hypothetical protein